MSNEFCHAKCESMKLILKRNRLIVPISNAIHINCICFYLNGLHQAFNGRYELRCAVLNVEMEKQNRLNIHGLLYLDCCSLASIISF